MKKNQTRKMFRTVLITGGAGFVGSYVVSEMSRLADKVVVVDSLIEQVHGPDPQFPEPVAELADCIRGDIRDAQLWERVGAQYPEIELVIHLAALTGTGQSMLIMSEYVDTNCVGTAVLLAALRSGAFPGLRHAIVASSRAVYGEGTYRCPVENTQHHPEVRPLEQLKRGAWNPACPACSRPLEPVLTAESSPPRPASVYGVTKWTQEGLFKSTLGAVVPVTILRFQNIFGPGQSLNNPYTGVLGVFYSRIAQSQPVEIFEDGMISRDFVFCTDAVSAIREAAIRRVNGIFNIGSGEFMAIDRVARLMCSILGRNVPVIASGKFREGDIRHNAADLSRARSVLGYRPRTTLEEGMTRYLNWAVQREPMPPQVLIKSQHSLGAC